MFMTTIYIYIYLILFKSKCGRCSPKVIRGDYRMLKGGREGGWEGGREGGKKGKKGRKERLKDGKMASNTGRRR